MKFADSHTHPYKCKETQCAENQGFTYNSDLTHHEREVHDQHERFFCSQLTCPHSRKGFWRQKSLIDHGHSRHSITPITLVIPILIASPADPSKRTSSEDSTTRRILDKKHARISSQSSKESRESKEGCSCRGRRTSSSSSSPRCSRRSTSYTGSDSSICRSRSRSSKDASSQSSRRSQCKHPPLSEPGRLTKRYTNSGESRDCQEKGWARFFRGWDWRAGESAFDMHHPISVGRGRRWRWIWTRV